MFRSQKFYFPLLLFLDLYMDIMNAKELLGKYLVDGSDLYNVVYSHSRGVAEKSLSIARKHPEFNADVVFLEEASLIHDIGVFKTYAPSIFCFGSYPYICHGYLGREIIEMEGFPKHALICERHTGTGLSLQEIAQINLPLPLRDMIPLSIEEKIICFSDLFFSKTHLESVRSIEKIKSGLEKYGLKGVEQFDEWCRIFL